MSVSRKRKSYDLDFRNRVITESVMNLSASQDALARQFNCNRSVIQRILKSKEVITERSRLPCLGTVKKCRLSDVMDIDAALLKWIKEKRSQNIPIDGPTIQVKALDFAKQLGYQEGEFKASRGWLNRFKKRHGISFRRIQGEGTLCCLHQIFSY